MASVALNQVCKSYADTQIIKHISLDIDDGEFVVFVGPSGCGKSTMLRMIAGLEDITSGEIRIGGRVVNNVSPSKRKVAMVFQSYALYPHMSVHKNMAFGLQQAKLPAAEIDQRVQKASEILQITDYLDRRPKSLSGGQRQRVAIGRAIVREPEVFLFDEPLSNLDAALRVNTRLEIARLHQRLATTMIYVTHDQVEAMTLADKIVVIRDGEIEQTGTPIELYQRPANMFVARFIGSPGMNFITASNLTGSAAKTLPEPVGNNTTIGIRPEHLNICSAANALVSAKMELIENLGEHLLVHLLTADNQALIAKMARAPRHKTGDTLHLNARQQDLHIFDSTSGIRKTQ